MAPSAHSSKRVAVIGGGIMGLTLAYYLTKQGMAVDVYEATPVVGGLAGPLTLRDGAVVDRFYHAILSSDSHLRALCAEVGIDDQLRFRATKMGFYHDGAIYPMNGILDFLRFPPLGWVDRLRLGLTVLAAQQVRDWQALEQISVEAWLTRWSGANTYTHLWRPMLRAKFEGNFDQVPATWIWSRLVRMKSTRRGARQKEEAGHLIGGYPTLLQAMAQRIQATGGQILLSTPVEHIVIEDEQATGIHVLGRFMPYAAVIGTVQAPLFSRLLPEAAASYRATLTTQAYLGILCPLLVLDRPLTGYWTLNIADESVPFTGIIETTAYLDPQFVGGHHLVYLPKYTAPGSAWQQKSDEEIRTLWLAHLQRMFPTLQQQQIREFRIHRERYVEPLHGLCEQPKLPAIQTPIRRLYLVTTAQIYPALTNGESVSRHAAAATQEIQHDLQTTSVTEATLSTGARVTAAPA
ncbi:MAG: NAD(P)/FAD-dependent oxidoreductase [Caldilineaceae bacterium]